MSTVAFVNLQKVLLYRIYVKIIRFLIIGQKDIDQRNCIIRGEKKTPKCILKKIIKKITKTFHRKIINSVIDLCVILSYSKVIKNYTWLNRAFISQSVSYIYSYKL